MFLSTAAISSASRLVTVYTTTDPFASRHLSNMCRWSAAPPRFLPTRMRRLVLSQLFLATCGCLSASTSLMSSRTFSTAVAVSAMTGTSPLGDSCVRISVRPRYDLRKSWPHCERQCASSTATRPSLPALTMSLSLDTK